MKKRKNGFSLICALLILSMLMAMSLSLVVNVFAHKNLTDHIVKKHKADFAVVAAARIALGELQQIAGVDCVITADIPDRIYRNGESYRTGAWNVKNPPAGFPMVLERNKPVPLVSNFGIPATDGKTFDIVHGTFAGRAHQVPRCYFSDTIRAGYAVVDESVRFPTNSTLPKAFEKLFDDEDDEENFAGIKQRVRPPWKFSRKKYSDNNDLDSRLGLYAPAYFFSRIPEDDTSHAAFPSHGVLADWQRNKLKSNLSAEDFYDKIFPENFLHSDAGFEKEFPDEGVLMPTEPAKEYGKLKFSEHPAPILADIKLHIGFFNARSDGQHRARFHISAALWNPYSFPILAEPGGNIGLINFAQMPQLSITNLNTEEKFTFDMSNFPTGQFGIVRQTNSDATFNVNGKIFDTSEQGFGSAGNAVAGLHAGEIFWARFPDPIGQPQGLSRITGGATWKYQKGSNPNKPPYGAIGGRWFHPMHKIQIKSAPTYLPNTLRFQYYKGSFPQNIDPREYSKTFWELKNFELPSLSFVLSGEEYNREDSSNYTIDDVNVVYWIRLKVEDEAAMKAFFEAVDLRDKTLDFSRSEVEHAFEISLYVGDKAKQLSQFTDRYSYLFDTEMNKHASESYRPSFSSIPIFDTPNLLPISTLALSQLHMNGLPQKVFGSATKIAKDSKINQIADRYFFAAPAKENSSVACENPFLEPFPFSTPDEKFRKNLQKTTAAANVMIRAPFNVNSTNARAWQAILKSSFNNWRQRSRRANNRSMPWDNSYRYDELKNVFFTRPFSAQSFSASIHLQPLTDEQLEKLDKRSREQFLLTQGLRSLPDKKIEILAKNLADKIKERLREEEPFYSLADFIDSGVLDYAIKKSQINEIGEDEIPEWFPNYLTQAHILYNLLPSLTPRGDTFTITVKAENINPVTGKANAATMAEIRVQRIPEFFDSRQAPETSFDDCNGVNRHFGRRFKIVSFSYLPN
ncbi:MAG: hypothetical protein LUD39_05910 [Opitutae bacterium]|nr:hypothetical protein [Opitutae bacterium]